MTRHHRNSYPPATDQVGLMVRYIWQYQTHNQVMIVVMMKVKDVEALILTNLGIIGNNRNRIFCSNWHSGIGCSRVLSLSALRSCCSMLSLHLLFE